MKIDLLNIYRPKYYRPRGELVVRSCQVKGIFPVQFLFLSWLTLAPLKVAFGQIIVSNKMMCSSQALCQQLGHSRRGWVLGVQA